MRAIILAGGRGTRLAPYTTVFPKPLMPLGEMPILEIVLRQLCHYGFTDITLAVGHLAELIKAFFGDGSHLGLRIDYSKEDEPLGTAGPLRLIENIDESFLVMNGDLLTTIDYAHFARYHQSRSALATIGLFEKEVRIDLGIVNTVEDNLVKEYIEKPILKYWVSMGIYIFEPQVLSFIPSVSKFDLPDLILNMIRSEQRIVGYPFAGRWLDIGRPEDYTEAATVFKEGHAEFLPNHSG